MEAFEIASREEWERAARERSSRHAAQTRKRVRRKQRQHERERLLRVGADPAWVERVLGGDDGLAA